MKLPLQHLLAALMTMAVTLNVNAKITGKIVDADDQSPLIEATLKLVKASRDSTFVNGATSDVEGNFSIPTVPAGRYVLKITYLGYSNINKSVTVPQSGKLALGTIAMKPSSVMLKEATVVGVKTEITVKEDTVEYNADSYKTQVNAVVEDLLKRLPGVEVGTDGSITANGKTVTKFLVDGKEFFADDPTVASKNLPANMIDKLQVIDRKSDLARLTGVDDGEDETVINLTVKKGMNQGWVGNVTAGYGSDDRYGARGMANYFRDGNQFSFVAGANNTNNMGFTDGGAARFSRGGGNSGINTSQNLGFNFNIGNEETFRIGGNVMYSHSSRDYQTQRSTIQSFTDYTNVTQSKSISKNDRDNVGMNLRLRWQIDSCNVIDFRPNMSLNFNKSWDNSISQLATGTTAADATAVNRSAEQDVDDGKSYEFGGELVYNHNFKSHKGRSFSAQVRYQLSNMRENNNTHTLNEYEDDAAEDEDISQLIRNHTWSNTVNGRITWTEPLGDITKANFLQFAYRANYRFNNSDKNVYDRYSTLSDVPEAQTALNSQYFMYSLLSDANVQRSLKETFGFSTLDNEELLFDILDRDYNVRDALDVFNHNQSSQFRNQFFTQYFQLGYKKVNSLYRLDAGVQLMGTMQKSKDLLNPERNITTSWLWSPAPYARIRFKFTKTRSLSIDYRANASQPSVTQLQPVPDVSNPMRISVGNPDLKATFSHRFNFRFNDFNSESQRSWMLNAGFNYTKNNVSSVSISDRTTGKSASTYTNLDGSWNANLMGMMSMPLPGKKFYFRSFMRLAYSRSEGYNVGKSDITTTDLTKAESILQYVSDDMLNKAGSFNFSFSPGMSFRTSIVELELRPTYGYQSSRNSLTTANNRDIHSYGGRFDGTLYIGNLVLNTDLRYTATSGYDSGYNTKQWIWNASIEYQFLRGKNATIGIKGYDMLGQRKNITFSNTGQSEVQSWTNSLGRYFMGTVSYRFQTFGKREKGAVDYDGFGPGPQGGPGFGPGPGPQGGPGGFGGGNRF
ncbi:MAG: outer membrane beta-barrel protein [Muribaculaceae bacterium]